MTASLNVANYYICWAWQCRVLDVAEPARVEVVCVKSVSKARNQRCWGGQLSAIKKLVSNLKWPTGTIVQLHGEDEWWTKPSHSILASVILLRQIEDSMSQKEVRIHVEAKHSSNYLNERTIWHWASILLITAALTSYPCIPLDISTKHCKHVVTQDIPLAKLMTCSTTPKWWVQSETTPLVLSTQSLTAENVLFRSVHTK